MTYKTFKRIAFTMIFMFSIVMTSITILIISELIITMGNMETLINMLSSL